MTSTKSPLTTLSPGALILDESLLTQIRNTTPLSPPDILNIAHYYMNTSNEDLARWLIFVALKIVFKDQISIISSPTSSVAEQPAATTATKTSPWNETLDQLEDLIWGYNPNDPEDAKEGQHPSIFQVEKMYWLPFSDSISKIGLLIEETGFGTVDKNGSCYIIGFSVDPASLPED